ncbi:MBL fold metallo-hydrolase [Sphingomonas lenta]|uniref:MBL fold metallo-hydrolase n=1 Tax=Sphingomonas lenta TaxID=1141887 RepID=UPI0015959BDC|nr:MBL fold metallo-hydrolase [Sphingomonas lenta]
MSAPAPLELQVYLSPAHPLGGGRTFSPVTSTLILGREEAVLVDAQFVHEDIEAVAAMIDGSGRRLTTIFITHGHADHYFGIDRLVARFPGVAVVATPGVVEYIEANHAREVKTLAAMMGDRAAVPTSRPTPLDEPTIRLEGEELRVIEVGQADIAPSTVLHVPSLDAVITGDVTYNGIHQMLGLTGPEQWRKWIESVDAVEALGPRIVVAGHKRPGLGDDEPARILDETRSYIRDFAAAAACATSPSEIVEAMIASYPEHGNVTTLHFSAQAAIKARLAQVPG